MFERFKYRNIIIQRKPFQYGNFNYSKPTQNKVYILIEKYDN